MNTDTTTVVGVFADRAQLEAAIQQLRAAGFGDDQIGVAVHLGENSAGGSDVAVTKSNMVEGVATGGVSGGIAGGLAGAVLVGLIPGLGPILAAGILEAVLSGVAAGTVTGGIVGGLIGLSVPEQEARLYAEEFRAGHSIVTVKARDRYQEALDILKENGAHDPQRHCS